MPPVFCVSGIPVCRWIPCWRPFCDGATPEEIVQQYDTLSLADVYAVISYYLEHQPDIDAYLAARRTQREQLHQEIETCHTPHGIRQRLLVRRKQA